MRRDKSGANNGNLESSFRKMCAPHNHIVWKILVWERNHKRDWEREIKIVQFVTQISSGYEAWVQCLSLALESHYESLWILLWIYSMNPACISWSCLPVVYRTWTVEFFVESSSLQPSESRSDSALKWPTSRKHILNILNTLNCICKAKCPSLIWPLHLDSSQVIIATRKCESSESALCRKRIASNFNLPFSLVFVILKDSFKGVPPKAYWMGREDKPAIHRIIFTGPIH